MRFSLSELRRRTLQLSANRRTAKGLQQPVPIFLREKVRQRKNAPLVNLII